MADSGGLQLIPQKKRTVEIRRPGENRLLYIGGAILLVFGGIGFAMSQYRGSVESGITEVTAQIEQVAAESRALREDKQKLRILASQLSTATTLVENHIFWTKGLQRVENRLRGDIQITALNANIQDKQLDIRAKSRSFTAIARQISSFYQDNAVLDVSLSRSSANTDGTIEFSMFVKFNEFTFAREIAIPSPRPSN